MVIKIDVAASLTDVEGFYAMQPIPSLNLTF